MITNRFRNGFARSGIAGLRISACLILLFCLAGLLTLASCDGNNDETATESMEMKSFFLSVNKQGKVVCTSEDYEVHLEGDPATGKLDITVPLATSEAFEQDTGHIGQKIIKTDSAGDVTKETILTIYVAQNADGSVAQNADGSFGLPGMQYVISTTNSEIVDNIEIFPPKTLDPIFTGFWTGPTFRPADHTFVICPYVLVPAKALNRADGMPLTCGGDDGAEMSPGLREYLGPTPTGSAPEHLGNCYRLFDSFESGKLINPTAVQ